MATEIITHNDSGWQPLYNLYISEGQPRNVVVGTSIYATVVTITGEVEFHSVDPIDYIDSRSLGSSKGASYKNLDG